MTDARDIDTSVVHSDAAGGVPGRSEKLMEPFVNGRLVISHIVGNDKSSGKSRTNRMTNGTEYVY